MKPATFSKAPLRPFFARILGYVPQVPRADAPSKMIAPEFATMLARALQDEADGKCIVMRDPRIRPRLPRKLSWE